jgi:hypothetical protein
MIQCPHCTGWFHQWIYPECHACGERLKGMQGPEQGIVGESRSDRQQGPAEDAKPGERGVGEIGGADELQRTMERMINEAREAQAQSKRTGFPLWEQYFYGKQSALIELRDEVFRISMERSDLANV